MANASHFHLNNLRANDVDRALTALAAQGRQLPDLPRAVLALVIEFENGTFDDVDPLHALHRALCFSVTLIPPPNDDDDDRDDNPKDRSAGVHIPGDDAAAKRRPRFCLWLHCSEDGRIRLHSAFAVIKVEPVVFDKRQRDCRSTLVCNTSASPSTKEPSTAVLTIEGKYSIDGTDAQKRLAAIALRERSFWLRHGLECEWPLAAALNAAGSNGVYCRWRWEVTKDRKTGTLLLGDGRD